jgi:hypothetical protein
VQPHRLGDLLAEPLGEPASLCRLSVPRIRSWPLIAEVKWPTSCNSAAATSGGGALDARASAAACSMCEACVTGSPR